MITAYYFKELNSDNIPVGITTIEDAYVFEYESDAKICCGLLDLFIKSTPDSGIGNVTVVPLYGEGTNHNFVIKLTQ